MSDRRRFGGMNTSSAAYGAGDTRADLIPLPSGSVIAADHPLESLEVPPSLRQVAIFIGTLLFIAGFGVGFYASVFVLLITEFH
jgi:hypothetical protein